MSAGHEHSHTPANFNKAFAIGIGLNIAFVMIDQFRQPRSCEQARLGRRGQGIAGDFRPHGMEP